jgi:hypothetical protein
MITFIRILHIFLPCYRKHLHITVIRSVIWGCTFVIKANQ